MAGQRPGKWIQAHMLNAYITLALILKLFLFRYCYGACLQAFSNEAPTSLHLSDCIQGAWAFQCPIHKRAEPSRQPTQMLRILTKGHPPTQCCLNDSLAHVTVKKAEQIVKCMISGDWKVFRERLPVKTSCKTFHLWSVELKKKEEGQRWRAAK